MFGKIEQNRHSYPLPHCVEGSEIILHEEYEYRPREGDIVSQVKQPFDGEKVDPSLYGKIMQNLALATMMMNHRRSSLTQRNIEQMNLQMQQQNDWMNNLLMQQQAMQAHQQAMQNNMTAVQMSTPGMGII